MTLNSDFRWKNTASMAAASNPADIHAYIGPHLQKCHFKVGKEVASLFENRFVVAKPDFLAVDLLSAIKNQLLSIGVVADRLEASKECTFLQPGQILFIQKG